MANYVSRKTDNIQENSINDQQQIKTVVTADNNNENMTKIGKSKENPLDSDQQSSLSSSLPINVEDYDNDDDKFNLINAFKRRLSFPGLKKIPKRVAVNNNNNNRVDIKKIDRSLSLDIEKRSEKRSSGNFNSTAPRSAPTTPQGQHLPISSTTSATTTTTTTTIAPHGCLSETQLHVVNTNNSCSSNNNNNNPSIQRSPSHTIFTKTDKTHLKHLSNSTPAMTAQGQLTEPPSPKTTKDPKIRTASKARQKKFVRHFPNVDEDEKVLNHYSCALIGDILLQGHLYITKNYFAFYSNVFGYVTKLLIPVLSVEDITKERTAKIIPNAVGIVTSEDKHVFGSLMSRDSTMTYMRTVWEKAKHEEAIPEPEIIEPDLSSESGESGRESPAIEPVPSDIEIPTPSTPTINGSNNNRIENVRNANEDFKLERPDSSRLIRTLKDAITEFRKLPRHTLILVATTLLLILLFLSATILLYRINKIQNNFSLNLQDPALLESSEGIYSDLFHWQSHLHSKSDSAVNNLLDNNLNQISKLRQSLEALSSLLTAKTIPEVETAATVLIKTVTEAPVPETSVSSTVDDADTNIS